MALPRSVNVVSYNMWLIPTYGAWNLGRIDRCRDRVAGETAKLLAAAPCDLSIVALQEAWTFRIGVFYPLIWLLARLETWLLKVGGYGGAAEIAMMASSKDAPRGLPRGVLLETPPTKAPLTDARHAMAPSVSPVRV